MSASRAPPRGDGGLRRLSAIRLSPWKALSRLADTAVMADTSKRRITRQGFGNPESAAGQGEKAGPQASSSNDRSFTLVRDLANVMYDATRKKSEN